MPANKNAVLRYKYLDDLLSDRHHHYTLSEIADKVNGKLEELGYDIVGIRQYQKDVLFLQERPFCAPIERYRSNGRECIHYTKSGYSIFSHELTREETSILYEVLNTVGQFKGLPNFGWLDGMRKAFGVNKHKKVLCFSNNPLLKNSNIMAALYECCANEQVLSVTYKRFSDVVAETYNIHPYQLRQYNNRWYLVGLRPDKGHIYTLPLDRIQEFTPLPEEKYIPYVGDIDTHFEDSIGITVFEDNVPVDIYFWISDEEHPYYVTKPLHKSMRTLDENEAEKLREAYNLHDGKIMYMRCCSNYELEREFARDLQNVIVLKPSSLRLSLYDHAAQMFENYKKLSSPLDASPDSVPNNEKENE